MTDDVALGPYGCESTSFLSVDGERRNSVFPVKRLHQVSTAMHAGL